MKTTTNDDAIIFWGVQTLIDIDGIDHGGCSQWDSPAASQRCACNAISLSAEATWCRVCDTGVFPTSLWWLEAVIENLYSLFGSLEYKNNQQEKNKQICLSSGETVGHLRCS